MSKKPDFEALKKEWNQKLKDSGLKEIENEKGLFHYGSYAFSRVSNKQNWEDTQNYYDLACSFLHEHKFTSRMHAIIWEYHANGISAANIARLLKEVNVQDFSVSKIKYTIKALKREMILAYLPTLSKRQYD